MTILLVDMELGDVESELGIMSLFFYHLSPNVGDGNDDFGVSTPFILFV